MAGALLRLLLLLLPQLLLLPLLPLSFGPSFSVADEHTHYYQDRDDVIFWVNTVGPYSNRQETYAFYQLPYCRGMDVVEHHHETLGEVLQGMELINAGIGGKFKVARQNVTLCTATLDKAQVRQFIAGVSNSYWYQMFVDDLPIWGFVGFVSESTQPKERHVYLYTHKEFSISYNADQIIEVNLTSQNPIPLDENMAPMNVRFSYSIEWVSTTKDFANRFDRYLDHDFFEHKIHWFSIFNSFMMVIFLVGLVTVILVRTLRKDYARYEHRDGLSELDRDLGDEYGWKQVHGDVFRRPPYLTLLASFMGTGCQLGVLTMTVILYTIMGDLYTERSTILTASIFMYTVTSIVAGYFSSSFYSKHGGKYWIRTMFVTALMWPGIVSAATIFMNVIALFYQSSKAMHFGTLVAIICIWIFLVFPLTLVGDVIGRNWAGEANFPCRVNPIPRQILEKKWYSQPIVIIALGGILPFGSIFIEMYFIFTSFWAYKIYYVYGFMLLVYIILVVVTSCVTIVSTYFLLNSEDHRWYWTSFLTSASTALYVFLYAIYYFFARTRMFGFFQTSFYFIYTAVICFGLFLVLGTVGVVAAETFVRKIYKNVKLD